VTDETATDGTTVSAETGTEAAAPGVGVLAVVGGPAAAAWRLHGDS
jgi:hypothetical protein